MSSRCSTTGSPTCVEGGKIYATAKGNPQGAEGMAEIPDGQLDAVIESAEECPGECIFIEP